MWNAEQGKLLRAFPEEHEEQVNHCEFTNTSRQLLLATCSNDEMMNVKVCMFFYINFFLISCILFSIFFVFRSYGISTSQPPRTRCLATLIQWNTAASPPMIVICPLPPTTALLRWLHFTVQIQYLLNYLWHQFYVKKNLKAFLER